MNFSKWLSWLRSVLVILPLSAIILMAPLDRKATFFGIEVISLVSALATFTMISVAVLSVLQESMRDALLIRGRFSQVPVGWVFLRQSHPKDMLRKTSDAEAEEVEGKKGDVWRKKGATMFTFAEDEKIVFVDLPNEKEEDRTAKKVPKPGA